VSRNQRPFRPSDVLKQALIQGLTLSSDGRTIVYSRRTVERGEYRSRLWRVGYDGGRPEQLTFGESDSRPRISSDGSTLLFLAKRGERVQPWVLPLAGGEPRQLAKLEGDVTAAEWSPDGRDVLLLALSGEQRFVVGDPENPVARRIDALNWRLDGVGLRDQFTSLWVVPTRGAKPRRLTEPEYELWHAFWSPDGERIGFLADLRPESALLEFPQAWWVPSTGGKPRRLARLEGAIWGAAWSPAGTLAFLGADVPQAPGWANLNLYVLERGRPRQLGRDLDRPIANRTFGDLVDLSAGFPPPVLWLDDENIVTAVADRGTGLPYRFGLDGRVEPLADGDVVCSTLAVGGGRLVAVATERGRAGEVYAVENGRLRALTRNGSSWLAPFRRDPERFRIPHPDGHELDAWLVPARGTRRRKPLVLQIHGGPYAAHGPTPWLEMCALADAGISVLYPNPRGSVGYGEDFARAIDGNWGERDSSDLLRVVDWAVEKGLADANRIGVLGLSYGGYMVNWLLGHYPGRFAAGVSENPVTDLFGFYGSSDAGLWIGPRAAAVERPAEDLTRLLDRSPAVELHRNEAPLLLLQAEGDLRCPPEQSELAFAILRALGRTVELVRYPEDSHLLFAVGRPDRRVDRLEQIVDWFQRYLM
jgi:dipeptidyl aminopeptidase/acylaminoacyl peptidase